MCKCVKVTLYFVTISLHASSRGRGIGTGSRPCRLASGTSRRGWWTRRSSQRSRRCSTAFTIITRGSLIRLYIHQSADVFIVLSGYLILTSWEWEREVWEIRWASIFHSELRVKESGQVGKKTNTPTKYISKEWDSPARGQWAPRTAPRRGPANSWWGWWTRGSRAWNSSARGKRMYWLRQEIKKCQCPSGSILFIYISL